MSYLLKLIVFTIATLVACTINDIIKIKTERRIGIAKRPFILFTRHLLGYLNFMLHIAILFIAIIFASQDMKLSSEYIMLPLVLIFVTKLLFAKNNKERLYLEGISIAAILICLLPVLLRYITPSWFSLIMALVSVKILNREENEPLPLNMARNLALNFYIFYVWFPLSNFYVCIIMAVLVIYAQNILYTFIPKFNQIKNSKLVLAWAFLTSLCIFVITSVVEVLLSGGYH